MRPLYIVVAVGTLLCGISIAQADAVKLTEEPGGSGTLYRLENYRVNLVIDPARGGAVVSYKDKLGGNVELIQQTKYTGLCLDHFQAQTWPGELLEVPYDVLVIKKSPEECILQLSRKALGEFRGHQEPGLKGVLIEKQYLLSAESPALVCRTKISAPAQNSSTPAYWLQNVFWAGGTYDAGGDWSFRPSSRGVRAKSKEKPGHAGTEDFLNDFSAGWLALLDKKSKSGLVFVTDYDDLKTLYVNKGNLSIELMFNPTYIPPGSSAQFTTRIIPVAGLDNVITATPDFIAGAKVTSNNKGSGSVTMDFVRSGNSIKSLGLDIAVKSVTDPQKVAKAGSINVESIKDTVKSGSVQFSGAGLDPLVIVAKGMVATTSGATNEVSFEDFFPGAYRWAENIDTDMSSPVYKGVRPMQKIKLNRPSKLALRCPGSSNVWFLDGLLDDKWKVNDSVNLVALNNPSLTKTGSATKSSGPFGHSLTFFPHDYEQLLTFNYIIVGGAKAEAMGPIGMEMLADFQKAGGGIILLGGPAAYGKSGFAGTRFEALLPVTIAKSGFDLLDVNGAEIKVANDLPMLQGLDWGDSPRVRYLHDVAIKPWGKVILTAGGKPFLVIGETPGKARVACFLGAPMGTVTNGQGVPFWEWRDMPYLIRQVAWWVTKQDHKFTLKID